MVVRGQGPWNSSTGPRPLLIAGLLAVLFHLSRPAWDYSSAQAPWSAWPTQLVRELRKTPALASKGTARTDDLGLVTLRWTVDRRRMTHIGLLGRWVHLPAKEWAPLVILAASCASFAAFSFKPAVAYRVFYPPPTGWSRPVSFVLAPFAQSSVIGLLIGINFVVSLGPEVEKIVGSSASSLCLYWAAGMVAYLVGCRVLGDRRCAHSSPRIGSILGWTAAVAVRRPHSPVTVYGVQMSMVASLAVQYAILVFGDGAPTAGLAMGGAAAVALGAAVGKR